MRESGVLLPIFSLPSRFGIGCFSKEAYEFVDQLEKAGQSRWQILPLGPTGYGDSPYQSFSTFAGNPYFIDLEMLAEEGLLTETECTQADFGEKKEEIDYEKLYKQRFHVLKKACQDKSGLAGRLLSLYGDQRQSGRDQLDRVVKRIAGPRRTGIKMCTA